MKIQNSKKGFTLIELIVAIGIFSIVMLAATSLTLSLIKSYRKALALQKTQETVRYVLEAITKEIRMSIINTDTSGPVKTINVRTPKDGVLDYNFNNDRIYRGAYPITPNDLKITGDFYIVKSGYPSRAFVTITMQAEHKDIKKTEEESKIYLQSSVSARSY